jgi:hypothetical protein
MCKSFTELTAPFAKFRAVGEALLVSEDSTSHLDAAESYNIYIVLLSKSRGNSVALLEASCNAAVLNYWNKNSEKLIKQNFGNIRDEIWLKSITQPRTLSAVRATDINQLNVAIFLHSHFASSDLSFPR